MFSKKSQKNDFFHRKSCIYLREIFVDYFLKEFCIGEFLDFICQENVYVFGEVDPFSEKWCGFFTDIYVHSLALKQLLTLQKNYWISFFKIEQNYLQNFVDFLVMTFVDLVIAKVFD